MTPPPSQQPLNPKQQEHRNLFFILSEARATSISQNIAEKYLVPFALVFHASAPAIAIVTTLPHLAGSLMQLFSVRVLHRFSSRKQLIAFLLFFQAVLWLPLFLIPLLFPRVGVVALIISFSMFYMVGGLFAPAWSHWVSVIVPEHARGRFYGKKNQIAGLYGFLAATIGGLLLYVFADINIWLAYGVLFFGAFIAKLFAAFFVFHMAEDETTKRIQSFEGITFKHFLRHINETMFGKYVLYMCCMNFAVTIATPFFTPYMLHSVAEGGLGFNYLQFTIINAIAACAGFSIFRHWGRITDRFGNKRTLVLTGLLVPFVPLLWLFSTEYTYLIAVEIFSAIIWAGFNLASANYVFDLIGSTNRLIYAAYYNSLTNITVFVGGLVGGGLYVLADRISINSIVFVFSISFLLRFAIALFFLTKLRELREVEGYHFIYELSLRPVQGFVHGTVQYVRDSFHHFKQKHMLDLIKLERSFVGEEEEINKKINKKESKTTRPTRSVKK
jgi:hypothetical protein